MFTYFLTEKGWTL